MDEQEEIALFGCRPTASPVRERRQEAILDAAEALFLEQGYERTSLAEIVKRSGGSLATLYDLFGNKQGLLHAIAARWSDETKFKQVEPNEYRACKHELLMCYARRDRDAINSPRAIALVRMLISEGLRDREFALQTYQNLHIPAQQELAELFAGWAADGEADIDDPDEAASMFLSLIHGNAMLNALAGIDDGVLSEDQIAWRLRPFLEYFKIR